MGGVERVETGNLKRACTALEVETEGREGDERFDWQRVGDLRYSFMHWVHTPQQAGPLGFGPSSADPESGEIISADAYIYGAGVDTYANFAADMVQMLNGELSPTDLSSGDNVVAEISKGRARLNEGLSKRTSRQLMQRVADLDSTLPDNAQVQLPKPGDINAADPRSALALKDQNMRLRALDGFAQEYLVDDNMLRAFAGPGRYQPGATPSPDAIKAASPSQWGRYPDPARQLSDTDPTSAENADAMGELDKHARLERFLSLIHI